jgi:DNA (cytosine-5)-methyltransferase 1
MLKVIELFSGIGSQTQALKNIGIQHEVVATCEWSINSIISYGEIHSQNNDYLDITNEEILEELKKYTFSMDTKTPYNLNKLKKDKLRLLYKNHKNSKNLASITEVDGSKLKCDLLTYSFPCQDLSLQGKQKGLYEGKSSSLLWQVGRILDEMETKPKILLMENVSSILNDKHKDGFDKWKKFLEDKGYKNIVMKLKSSNFNNPQNRERCYMVSSLDHNLNLNLSGYLTNLRIKDILEKDIDEKYYKSNLIKHLPNNINFRSTKNGIQSIDLVNYTTFASENKVYSINSIAPTLTATGANSRIKILNENNEIRTLTPLECWKLMGFTKKEYNMVKDVHSENEVIKQAGNSIVVNVLENIFKEIYK